MRPSEGTIHRFYLKPVGNQPSFEAFRGCKSNESLLAVADQKNN